MEVLADQQCGRPGPWGDAMRCWQKKAEGCVRLKRHVKGYSCTLLHGSFAFILFQTYCTFYKLKVNGNSALGKMIFFNSICSFHVSVSHFGNSHSISNFFYYYFICYGDL